jgi:hypothetical protein
MKPSKMPVAVPSDTINKPNPIALATISIRLAELVPFISAVLVELPDAITGFVAWTVTSFRADVEEGVYVSFENLQILIMALISAYS